MKYLLYIAIVGFLIVSCDAISSTTQEKYKSHKVSKGETVFSIAKQYNTTQEAIYSLNPDARDGVKENTILVIPSGDVINSSGTSSFKMHKVKRKETLFSISQLYGVSIDDIKKYNKHLYAKQVKKGEKLRIPIKNTASTTTTTTETTATSSKNTHTVQPKETKFGIARMYGITVAQLEALNPDLGEGLPVGISIHVPEEKIVSEEIDNDKYTLYEVQPKEGFYRLKVKFGLTEEEIVSLNPYAKDGLKEGMILKLPKNIEIVATENVSNVNLESSLTNKSEKNIALMLPFMLNRASVDSINNTEVLQEQRTMRIALDFYSGALMAAEFAKDKGVSVTFNVFDTEANASKVSTIISANNVNSMDAVIGPLLSNNVEKASSALNRSDVPVFSPLSNRKLRATQNVFQTLPDDEILENGMLQWIQSNSAGNNIVLISDASRRKQKEKIVAALPQAKTITPREKGFLYIGDIDKHMARGTADNWVIVETTNPVLLSNVVTLLNGMPKDYNVRLFTLDKNKAFEFDDVSNMNLARLGLTFPSVSKSYSYDEKDPFLISYKNKYGVLPNKYAVRGFDVTYDVLLRLASSEDFYKEITGEIETEYIESKFRYQPKATGYANRAMYILQYNKDLNFDVVK
ncbi:LysM peptidoglycan-binding domain-containing protein [Marinirhabdus gelatinilytica]|uniref:Amino acid/amide ABC transporter substrate-binding protein (HAAT family) n=1 Tax=Marinirhabdus gelatinilytica TaxID=1703343 RepID=A0A370QB41_9FLAO|nr:LysM peptidoglycan-binding domain-containing protein [Marinirhabdus gelatinilytica]RDK85593.1 amino acid/amide ABC transporter substrate-binding protein (HAAT family) [Marinirhabdus gelatinilytica]